MKRPLARLLIALFSCLLLASMHELLGALGDPQAHGQSKEPAPSKPSEKELRWRERALRVVHANIVMPRSFWESFHLWKNGSPIGAQKWTRHVKGDLVEPIVLKELPQDRGSILIEGDCLADIEFDAGGLIHIQGDVKARIRADDRTELVIGGHVLPTGSIELGSNCSLFVGGDVLGEVELEGSPECWIEGSLNGELATAGYATVHILGDCNGSMRPAGTGTSLSLVVGGFMASEKLLVIAQNGTDLSASIARSDQEPWLYPKTKDAQGINRHDCHWVVLAQRKTQQ